ncbi:predicted protein, partial [Nematostella vectensis]
TWSSLATAFNYPGPRKDEHLHPTGLFGVPELNTKSGFQQMKNTALSAGSDLVKKVLSKTGLELVEVFDELSDTLCRVADLAEFVRVSHPDLEFREAAEETSLSVSNFVETLNTNHKLYSVLKNAFYNEGDAMSEETRKVAELFLFDFELSGIHLEEQKRQQFVELQDAILILGSQFSQGAGLPVLLPKGDCPDRIKNSFPVSGDNVAIDTMYLESSNEELRELAFRSHLHPIPEQLHCLDLLLSSRNELAQLVDFPTFAHRALKGTMVKTPKNVMNFLVQASQKLKKPAEKELRILESIKKMESGKKQIKIMPWDFQYYTGLAKTQALKLNSLSLSAYFPLGSCMEGLNFIFQNIYGITLEPEDASPGELWSTDVQKLGIVHEQEGLLGYIYCDFFARPEKLQQDSHFTIKGKILKDGTYQLPIVAIICNFPPPSPSGPSLLTHGMVENLFHEMGHAMHSMLARTRYQHVTGTRCSTDFAEVPSVLMEYFAWDSRVLNKFARHFRTGQPLPEEMVNKLCQSRNMFGALEMQRQILYSIADQIYHGKHPLQKNTTDIMSDIQKEHTVIPFVSGVAWQQRFSHLNGYGARYYSYLWSRAVASMVWHQCFHANPFSREVGDRYRSQMLAHGGGKDPNALVAGMLGKELTTEDMVQALWDDLADCNPFYL